MCASTSGEIAELLFAALALQLGFEISRPLKACPYDFIVDWNGTLKRIQVKSTTVKRKETYQASTYSKNFGVYTKEMVDFFAIQAESNFYIIPVSQVKVKTLTLGKRMDRFKNNWEILKGS